MEFIVTITYRKLRKRSVIRIQAESLDDAYQLVASALEDIAQVQKIEVKKV